MTVTWTLNVTNYEDAVLPSAFNTDLQQAAADWSQYLNSNAHLVVQVDVGNFPQNAGFLVQNDANDFVTLGTTSTGLNLVEPWGEYALQTDSHVPGTTYDIHIYVDLLTNYGGATLSFNPNPAVPSAVPAGEYDATTMFLKALGYGLGFSAMTTTDAAQASVQVTPLDQYVQLNPNGPSGLSLGVDEIGRYELTGSVVEAVNGGPVTLVTPPVGYDEAFEHVGNTPTIGGSSDIMAVTQDIVGESLQISALDLAIMKEAGVPIVAGVLPCFAEGTRLLTPRGALAIEALREGDEVITLSGVPRAIRWIGRRSVDCSRHPTPHHVRPVRIVPDAFGVGRPSAAIMLSPDHAVFIEDVLIPIRLLVNHSSIAQVMVETITYYHIELDQHDIVLAEGLPVETYLESGVGLALEKAGPRPMLYPELCARQWDVYGYAPLVVHGEVLARARAKLRVQAGLLDRPAWRQVA